jgi:hypothetical protein
VPAQSTAEALGDAAKTAVLAIGILKPNVAPDTAVPCVKRKTPSVPEGEANGLPQFVISVSEEEEVERLTAAHKLRTIRFAITIVSAGGQKAGEDVTVQKWLEQIDDAIYDKQRTAFAGVTGFIHLRAFGGKVYDPGALAKDFNYSPLAYEAKVAETLAT